jgi:hypothetical protein
MWGVCVHVVLNTTLILFKGQPDTAWCSSLVVFGKSAFLLLIDGHTPGRACAWRVFSASSPHAGVASKCSTSVVNLKFSVLVPCFQQLLLTHCLLLSTLNWNLDFHVWPHIQKLVVRSCCFFSRGALWHFLFQTVHLTLVLFYLKAFRTLVRQIRVSAFSGKLIFSSNCAIALSWTSLINVSVSFTVFHRGSSTRLLGRRNSQVSRCAGSFFKSVYKR